MDTKEKSNKNIYLESKQDVSDVQSEILDKKLSEKQVQNKIDSMSEEELLALKRFLFEERIRVIQEKDEQKAVYEKS